MAHNKISRRTFMGWSLVVGATLFMRGARAVAARRAPLPIFLPMTTYHRDPPSPKKALAWAGALAHPDTLADPELLRMPAGFRWLFWSSALEVYTSDGRPYPPGKVPMLFGVESPSGNWDPVAQLYHDIPQEYDGELIFLNEGDLEWQANLTPQQAADLFAVIAADFPNTRFIAPNVSQRDISLGCPWLREFLTLIGPELRDRIWRIGWHWYDYDPERRDLNYAVETVYGVLADFGMEHIQSWVTEMGCKRTHPGYLERFELWWQQAFAEDRIELVFAFANRDEGLEGYRPVNAFSMIELESGELMDTGAIFAEL